MKNKMPIMNGIIQDGKGLKENKMKWEWNGHKLPPIYRLVLRLIMIPVAHIARLVLTAAIYIGWGKSQASRVWRDTQ